jgi:hypothetical protein
MQYDAMCDRHPGTNLKRVQTVGHVQYRIVLYICPVADPDIMHVTADRDMKPDSAVVADRDIAYYISTRGNEYPFTRNRNKIFIPVNH